MPEEINRLITDAISDVLWTPSEDADQNLVAEGVSHERIDLIGNIMIDSFEMLREHIERSDTGVKLGLAGDDYALVTLHRPSNVDDRENLEPIVAALIETARELPVVFVAHPRTMSGLKKFGLRARLDEAKDITLLDPLPYVQFMSLVTGSRMVITDSGGLQEETTYLGIPCLTLRENTERPITVTMGTNQLVSAQSLDDSIGRILTGEWKTGECPPLWDGKTAERAVAALKRRSTGKD
jgi:UDP-N-acetylglucosamine 2-epimerase (non-hydrolysing)